MAEFVERDILTADEDDDEVEQQPADDFTILTALHQCTSLCTSAGDWYRSPANNARFPPNNGPSPANNDGFRRFHGNNCEISGR